MPQGCVKGRTEHIQRGYRRVASKLMLSAARNGKLFIGSRKRASTGNTKSRIIRVVCPSILSLHTPNLHAKTVEFVKNLEKTVRESTLTGRTVHICFRNTRKIYASGGIYLLANTDVLVNKYPTAKFTCSIPPNIPDPTFHASLPVVHSVLCQIGFYRLIGIDKPKGIQLPNVDCWHVSSSGTADGSFIGTAIEKLERIGANIQGLYRSSIEAVANASEHAYSTELQSERAFVMKKWWLFSAVMDDQVLFYICDLGHGIPKTLEHTQPPELLATIKNVLSKMIPERHRSAWVDDVYKIKMSTMVKETRTALSYRGKGGGDLKSYISKHGGSSLHIYSNQGAYVYKNKKKPKRNDQGSEAVLENNLLKANNRQYERGYNNKMSIGGTVVGWSMPLTHEGF